MRIPSILSTAALALTTDAFLLPPDVSTDAVANAGVLDVASAFSTTKQVIDLECQDCLAAVGKHGVVAYRAAKPETGTKMSVEMKFEVHDGQLTLNNAPLYPPPRPGSQPILYTARQIVSGPSSEFFDRPLPLSVSIEILPTDVLLGSDGTLQIHPIKIEPLGLGQFPVHTPTVHVKLAELENGQFKLLPLSTSRYRHNPAVDACTSIVCRARHVVMSKMAAFRAAAASRIAGAWRGCHGRIFGGAHPHRGPAFDGAHGRTGDFQSFHGHHHGRHGHHHSGFRGVASRAVHFILLPVIFGICSGVLVGAVLTLTFKAVRAVVRRVRGEPRGAYAPIDGDEAEAGRAGADGLPQYEDVVDDDEKNEKDELLPSQRA